MRQHLEHLAAALGLLAVALYISWFHTGPLIKPRTSVNSTNASLTPLAQDTEPVFATSTLPGFTLGTSSLETLFPKPATTTVPFPAKTTPSRTPISPTPKPAPAPVVTPPPAPKPTATTTVTTSDATQPAPLKNSIVNILCTSHTQNLRSLSGSGVVIDSKGVILTVAHVAQALLLEEYLGSSKMSCVIRTGSPARDAYKARPVYVPNAWVKANATTLISSQPLGTGAYDYALLAITGTAGKTLPGAFPAIELASTDARIGDDVSIGSYGAQTLTSAQIKNSLVPTFVSTTVKTRYTLGNNTPDVLSLAGSSASQEGSSGGGAVSEGGDLIGLIVTSQVTGEVSKREMRVITPSYIRRSFKEDSGKNLDTYIGDTGLNTLVSVYAPTAASLGEFIAKAIGVTK